ncbi:MAG: FadR family transcriptional regulator [Chloroflexi bacterium]|nr:FadR family transcriptional regulator [Chloroflexota bacterium]
MLTSHFTLTPPKKTTVVEDIVEQLTSQIQEGLMQPGDRLPAERQMMEMLNVSRASVRGALQTLAGMGFIDARVGEGTFVKAIKPHLALEMELRQMARNAQRQDRLFLLESRTVVEKGILEFAIANGTAEDCQLLQAVTDSWIEQCREGDVKLDLHDQIHITLAEMTGNPLLVLVLQTLLKALPPAIRNYGILSGDGPGDQQALSHELTIHARLTQAVIDRDLTRALVIFTEHQAQEADLIQRYYS